jgi:hypothetical protein
MQWCHQRSEIDVDIQSLWAIVSNAWLHLQHNYIVRQMNEIKQVTALKSIAQ